MGKYNGQSEIIDSFEDETEAWTMLSEYIIAFGSNWQIWIEEK